MQRWLETLTLSILVCPSPPGDISHLCVPHLHQNPPQLQSSMICSMLGMCFLVFFFAFTNFSNKLTRTQKGLQVLMWVPQMPLLNYIKLSICMPGEFWNMRAYLWSLAKACVLRISCTRDGRSPHHGDINRQCMCKKQERYLMRGAGNLLYKSLSVMFK